MLFFGGEQILGKKDGKLNSGFKWDNLTLEKTGKDSVSSVVLGELSLSSCFASWSYKIGL